MSTDITSDPEWFVPESTTTLRQGDVLICRDPRSGRIDEICLVITADCDISKGKFGRHLACLRIVPLEEYIRTVWATRKLEKSLKNECEKLRGQVAKWHTLLLGTHSALSTEAAVAWVRREKPTALCETLHIPDSDRKKFVAALTSFRSAFDALDNNAANGAFSKYTAFRAALRGQEAGISHQETLQEAQKESMPEDVFLLPSLPQIEIDGAVVMLREVVGVKYEAVRYRTADAQTPDAFLRVGRLKPTFKYAVSQAFGALYSRIGLPDNYEDRCKGAIASISNFSWK